MQTRKIKKWANGRTNSGSKEARHYTAILAANAMGLGWLNGHRLVKKGA